MRIKMKQNTKDWLQYSSAITMLGSAIALAVWSFARISEVHNTILAYVGEAIAFAAAVFGLALYARNEIQREFRKWQKTEDDRLVRNEEDDA